MGWHSNEGYSTEIQVRSKAWDWAAVSDITYDYYIMCENTEIAAPPQGLNILVGRESSKSYAPMLSKLGTNNTPDFNAFYNSFGEGNISLSIPAPDVVIGSKNRSYLSLCGLVGHELAHASHFSQVGSSFWTRYINHIIGHIGYGNGDDKDSELCAIGEMWGYSMEIIREKDCSGEPYSEMLDLPPVEGWIPRMLFLDLCRRGYLTPDQIYVCLTPEVDTFVELYNKMLEMYPHQYENIKWAFNSNGIMVNNADFVHCPSPSDIQIGEEFEIYWVKSEEGELCDIEFSFLKENYFDGDSSMHIIIIPNESKKCKTKIKLTNYGHYIIEAKVKDTDEKRYFHIAKFYKSKWSAYNPLGLEGSLPVATEPFTGTLTSDASNASNHYIDFGIDAPVERRMVAVIQQNVLMQKEGEGIRWDRRWFNVKSDTMIFSPRPAFTMELPAFGTIGGEWNDELNDSEATYIYKKWNYYAVLYPDDVCECLDYM